MVPDSTFIFGILLCPAPRVQFLHVFLLNLSIIAQEKIREHGKVFSPSSTVGPLPPTGPCCAPISKI